MTTDIDQSACFYLGREYDLARKSALPDRPVMYEARDLTTHGVVVGMTGSGKTGLAISLLEEAAIDGIPCVIIDPKGDLGNLLLQFPDLAVADFARWLNPEDAQQQGLTTAKYAAQIAERWRQGLADTGQTPARIDRLRQSSEWRIYTPGSEAGLPLSILGSFAAPRSPLTREALNQKIDATATALLGLTGLSGDPVQSREHILIAQLLLHAWGKQQDLDLHQLILQIQNPPVRTVGAYSLETFFPAKERLKFASSLNNVLAAPSFSTWTTGEPLDLARMLHGNGKPRQLVFHVAHLDDTQRMFFITLLLEEMLTWTRKQSGTSNLKALLYFDEVFGYLPPVANPPSKAPLLTLLKQARAFGVGILLATQNPVDLDYKALSNAGTWFVGKLQTERDKARLLDGLESAAAEQGAGSNREYLESVISALGNRVFLLHNVHRGQPVLFQSRWALSFLRGPMTRDQVAELMEPLKKQQAQPAVAIPLCTSCQAELAPDVADRCPHCGQNPWARAPGRVEDQAFKQALAAGAAMPSAPPRPKTAVPQAAPAPRDSLPLADHQPPVLPAEVTQFYLPRPSSLSPATGERGRGEGAGEVQYRPWVLGFAEVVFVVDRRKGLEHRLDFHLLAAPPRPGQPVNWKKAQKIGDELASPEANACWDDVPEAMDTGRKLKALEKAFADHLYSNEKLPLWQNRSLELVSEPGEAREAFQERCRAAARQEADAALQLERAKFAPKFEALDAALPEEEPPHKDGGSWLDWINPFKATETDQPATKAEVRQQARREEKVRKLTADYQAKKAEIAVKWKRIGEECDGVQVKPRKADVRVTHFGLAWVPGKK